MIEPLGCKVHPRSAPRFRRSQPCAAGWCCSERPEGKGTQAQLLNQRLGAGDLSTRDVFRAAGSRKACEQTPAMAAALDYDLVPDSTVWEMLRERSGCLLALDGFPRMLGQAEALSQLMEKENLALSAVMNYELPVAEIVSRLSGRRICEKCKAVFHVTMQPSRSEGICDECGGMAVPTRR